MQSRRIACFFLGLWLGAAVLMAWVGSQAFRAVDHTAVAPNPSAAVALRALGPLARPLVRYLISEQNRALFETWGTLQLVLGVGFFFFLLFGSEEGKLPLGIGLFMVLVVAVQRFLLTPEMTSLGRTLDFLSPASRPGDWSKFWVLHGAYLLAEGLKWALGGFLIVLLCRHRGRSGQMDFDLVDRADHRPVSS